VASRVEEAWRRGQRQAAEAAADAAAENVHPPA
jgi:hypothetical protein